MSDKTQTKQNPKPLFISKFLYSVTKRFYLNFNTQGVVEDKYSLSQQTLSAFVARDHSSNQKPADV